MTNNSGVAFSLLFSICNVCCLVCFNQFKTNGWIVVMGGGCTLTQFFKPDKNVDFFQTKMVPEMPLL